jgi:hypothetical protein
LPDALFLVFTPGFPNTADVDERTRARCIGAVVALAVGDTRGSRVIRAQ